MADTKISALTAASALGGTEAIPAVQGGVTTKATPAQIATYVSANASPLTVAGGTVTASTPTFNATQTWNSGATTFTGLKLNVTDTASGGSSLLMDLQVGGTSKFNVLKSGSFVAAGSLYFAQFNSATNLSQYGLKLQATGVLQFASSDTAGASVDLSLARDAANTLAQRNSTNAQTFNVYNTYTDASNYERLDVTWSSNVAYIKPAAAGTGSTRLFVPVTGSTTVSGLPSASTAGAGARSFVTDASGTTFLSPVIGGGANKVPVVSDGTNWRIG